MWMMNCNEHGKEFKISDDHMLLHARKLRPLLPRTIASTKSSTCSTMAAPNCCCIPNRNISAWNYHLPNSSVHQSKRVLSAEPLVSPRWNPTPEQIQALEDMYRRGLRTPTAEQIQQIAAKLRQFGKIEGKNVFYWFQNHKARERQKWRRQLSSITDQNNLREVETLSKKESEISKRDIQVEQAKNWAILSNCSTISQVSASKHREVIAESRTNGWVDLELQQTTKSKRVKKATLHADNYLFSNYQPNNINYLFNNTTTKFRTDDDDIIMEHDDQHGRNRILQLFPLGRNNQTNDIRSVDQKENDGQVFSPRTFFEFLPLKA